MQILVPFNSRAKSSKAVLELAKEHANIFTGEVLIVTSADPTVSNKDIQAKEEAEMALIGAQKEFEQEGISCSYHLLIRGYNPGEDIVRFAEEKDVDEIIIGIEKKSRVGKFLLGSMAQQVILTAPCPVVTVKSPEYEHDIILGSTSIGL